MASEKDPTNIISIGTVDLGTAAAGGSITIMGTLKCSLEDGTRIEKVVSTPVGITEEDIRQSLFDKGLYSTLVERLNTNIDIKRKNFEGSVSALSAAEAVKAYEDYIITCINIYAKTGVDNYSWMASRIYETGESHNLLALDWSTIFTSESIGRNIIEPLVSKGVWPPQFWLDIIKYKYDQQGSSMSKCLFDNFLKDMQYKFGQAKSTKPQESPAGVGTVGTDGGVVVQ